MLMQKISLRIVTNGISHKHIGVKKLIVVSAGTHIGKLHDLLEQDKIFSPTDGKQRLKFVNSKTPHFKPYEGDKNNG